MNVNPQQKIADVADRGRCHWQGGMAVKYSVFYILQELMIETKECFYLSVNITNKMRIITQLENGQYF